MTAIRQILDIDASPRDIHAALSTDAGLKGWWSRDSDIAEHVGGTHELRFDKDGRHVVMRFVIDALDPDRVAWTCTDNGNPVWPGTTLEWRIEARGDRARVEFVHDGFADDTSPPFQMTAQGWQHFCSSLKAYAETGQGMPW